MGVQANLDDLSEEEKIFYMFKVCRWLFTKMLGVLICVIALGP